MGKVAINAKGRVYDVGKKTSEERRNNIIEQYNRHQSYQIVANIVACDVRTVRKVVNNEYRQRIGRPSVLMFPELLMWMEIFLIMFPQTQITSLTETICDEFQIKISRSHVNNIVLYKLGFSRKRLSHIAKQREEPRIQNLRIYYTSNFPFGCDTLTFIYIDESHFDHRDLNPRYGYSKVGEPGEVIAREYTRSSYSLLMGINHEIGVVHYVLKNTEGDGIKAEDFDLFLEGMMLALDPMQEYVVVMDNARVHRTSNCRDVLAQFERDYIFLPPYSPDFNPIELVFAEIKREIKKDIYLRMEMGDAIEEVIERRISLSNIQSYISHSINVSSRPPIN